MSHQFISAIQTVHPPSAGKAAEIISHFKPITVSKSDLFLREGKVSNNYLFLEEGIMRAFTHDTNGEEITTAFFSSGDFVIEVASFFQRIPTAENIQAITDCKGWIITFEQIQMLFHSMPEFREFGRAALVKNFVSFKSRSLSLINETAEKRYYDFVKARPELIKNVPLKYIASYLGVTDSSLSRIRRQFSM